MRIAHCISGTVRGAPDPAVEAFTHNFVHGFKSSLDPRARNATSDVFMVLELEDGETNVASNNVGTTNSKYGIWQLGQMLHKLAPVVVEMVAVPSNDTNSCDPDPANHHTPSCPTGTEMICKYASQWNKVKQCYELVQAHEAKLGRRYDWVTRIRPDAYLTARNEFKSAWSLDSVLRRARTFVANYSKRESMAPTYNIHYGPPKNVVGDHFAIVPRARADTYFALRDAFDMCVEMKELGKRCHGPLHNPTWVPPDCVSNYWLRVVQEMPLAGTESMDEVLIHMVRSNGAQRGERAYF